jgi:hypothetical protein
VAITSEENQNIKGTAKAEWVLGGRFVRQTGAVKSPDASEDTQLESLLTYDPDKKTYLTWTFMSDGSHLEAEATWNEATKTMTSVAHNRDGGVTTTTTADFSHPGVERWKIVSTTKTSDVIFELRGENTRREQ